MDNLNQSFANNLLDLRKGRGMTQAELAEKLNYSDKAVSKWERGDSIPDITVLMQIAELFEVSVDFLMADHSADQPQQEPTANERKRRISNRFLITLISGVGVWVVAVLVYVVLKQFLPDMEKAWLCFIYAVPVCAVVIFVLNCLWGKKWIGYLLISVFIWSVLTVIYLQALPKASWMIFLIGAPLQVVTVLASGIVKTKKTSKDKKNR